MRQRRRDASGWLVWEKGTHPQVRTYTTYAAARRDYEIAVGARAPQGKEN